MNVDDKNWIIIAKAGETDNGGNHCTITTWHKEYPGHDLEAAALETAKNTYRWGFDEEAGRFGVAVLPYWGEDEDEDKDIVEDDDFEEL